MMWAMPLLLVASLAVFTIGRDPRTPALAPIEWLRSLTIAAILGLVTGSYQILFAIGALHGPGGAISYAGALLALSLMLATQWHRAWTQRQTTPHPTHNGTHTP